MGSIWQQPNNEVDFEHFCKRFLTHHWRCPHVQRLGKRGERQFGIDLIDASGGTPMRVAQCKHHEPTKTIPYAEILADVEKTKHYLVKIDEYFVLTTARKSESVQTKLLALNRKRRAAGDFHVILLAWQDINELLDELGEDIRDQVLNGDTGRTITDIQRMITTAIQDASPKVEAGESTQDIELDYVKTQIANHEYGLAKLTLGRLEAERWDRLSDRQRFRVLSFQANILLAAWKFEEAGQVLLRAVAFQPTDEKAQVNEALGYELLRNRAKAWELAETLCTRYPHSTSAHAIRIRMAPTDLSLLDLIKSTPEHALADAEVAAAIASLAVQRKDASTAVEYGRKSVVPKEDWPAGWMVLGHALQLAGWKVEALEKRQTLLREAEAAYSKAAEHGHDQHAIQIESQSLLNRGIVREMLGAEEAEADYAAAVKLDPSDDETLQRYALHLAERGQLDKAVTSARSAYQSGKSAKAAVLLSSFLFDRKGSGDCEEAQRICNDLLATGSADFAADALEVVVQFLTQEGKPQEAFDLLQKLPEIQLPALARETCRSRILLAQGSLDDAIAVAKAAIALISNQSYVLDRWRLARLLARLGAHFQAVDVCLGIAKKGSLDPVTLQLLASAQISGRHDVLLRVLKELREAGNTDPRILQNEIALLRTYRPEEAISVLQAALAKDPSNKYARLLLANVAKTLHRKEFNCADPLMLPAVEGADPSTTGRWVVGALCEAGNTKDALLFVYELLRRNFSDVDAHRNYLFLFLSPPFVGDKPSFLLSDPDVAVAGSAVAYRETGETDLRWILIEDSLPIHPECGEVNIADPLAVAFLGHAAGEIITLAEGIQPRTATIEKILNKFVYRFQEGIHNFQVRFPKEHDFQLVRVGAVDGSGEATFDLSAIQRSLESRKEYVNQLLDLYRDQCVPLHMLAKYVGYDLFSVLNQLIGNKDTCIKCCLGNREERTRAVEAMDEKRGLVVDATALFAIAFLGRLDLLSGWEHRPVVSHATYQLLLSLIDIVRSDRSEGMLTLDDHGHLCHLRGDPKGKKTYIAFLEGISGAIQDHCVVKACPELSLMDPIKRQQYLDGFGQHGLEAIVLASNPGMVLWTDDFVLGGIAGNEYGVRRVWTQIVLHASAADGRSDIEMFALASVRLHAAGYQFTWWSTEILEVIANREKWDADRPFLKALLQDLGSKNVHPEGRLLLAATAVQSVCRTEIEAKAKFWFVSAILDQLARLDLPWDCAAAMEQSLEGMQFDPPAARWDAKAYIWIWYSRIRSELVRNTFLLDLYVVPPCKTAPDG